MNIELTKQEIFFRKSMGVLCILFLLGVILFATIPDHLLSMINSVGTLFDLKRPLVPSAIPIDEGLWKGQIAKNVDGAPYDPGITKVPGTRLWIGLAVTMMFMISVIAGMNFINPRKYIGWVPLLLISKASTSVLGIIFYFGFGEYKYMSNIILTITDFPIFIFVLVIWLRAKSAQKELE